MPASESVHASLQSIGFVQLVFLFAVLIAYGLALGAAFPARVRAAAAASGVLAAIGFSATAPALADGVVVLALAVALVGAFSGAAWLVASMLRLDAPRHDRAPDEAPTLTTLASRSVDAMLSSGRAGAATR